MDRFERKKRLKTRVNKTKKEKKRQNKHKMPQWYEKDDFFEEDADQY